MKTFAVTTFIPASAETVWAILTNGSKWTLWNPTIEKIEGAIVPGGTIRVFTRLNPEQAFPVQVTELVPARRMVWTGGLPFGLFKAERVFTLSPMAGGCEFFMREQFSGLLAPLMTRSIPDLQPSFNEFADALKRRVERAA
jgi:hypothetical protein